jgi:hypothetical protein
MVLGMAMKKLLVIMKNHQRYVHVVVRRGKYSVPESRVAILPVLDVNSLLKWRGD